MEMTRKELIEKMSEQIDSDEGEVADVLKKLLAESLNTYSKTIVEDRIIVRIKKCRLCKTAQSYSKNEEEPLLKKYHICESCERMLKLQHEVHEIECEFEEYVESEVVMNELLEER